MVHGQGHPVWLCCCLVTKDSMYRHIVCTWWIWYSTHWDCPVLVMTRWVGLVSFKNFNYYKIPRFCRIGNQLYICIMYYNPKFTWGCLRTPCYFTIVYILCSVLQMCTVQCVLAHFQCGIYRIRSLCFCYVRFLLDQQTKYNICM